jgi:Holliday junction resolvase
MTINSRSKGKRGELELVEVIRAAGWEARRGQQYKGGIDSPDVITNMPGNLHIECKRVEAGNLYVWLEQAVRDAKPGDMPVVMHKKNAKPWVAILDLEDFFTLVKKGNNDNGN